MDKQGQARSPSMFLVVMAVFAWHSWYYGRFDEVLPLGVRRLKKKDDDGCEEETLGMMDMVDAAVSFKVATQLSSLLEQSNVTSRRELMCQFVRACLWGVS